MQFTIFHVKVRIADGPKKNVWSIDAGGSGIGKGTTTQIMADLKKQQDDLIAKYPERFYYDADGKFREKTLQEMLTNDPAYAQMLAQLAEEEAANIGGGMKAYSDSNIKATKAKIAAYEAQMKQNDPNFVSPFAVPGGSPVQKILTHTNSLLEKLKLPPISSTTKMGYSVAGIALLVGVGVAVNKWK